MINKDTQLSFVNISKSKNDFDSDLKEIIFGLTKNKKAINSKFLYDEKGSDLFEEITTLDEYYPTRTEMEILENSKGKLFDLVSPNPVIVEFGSGSLLKINKLTKVLNTPLEYIPIDISKDYLFNNASVFSKNNNNIKVTAICSDFNDTKKIREIIGKRKNIVGFFPGSTIGNFHPKEASLLLKKFGNIIGKNNILIVGVDLKKDIKIIEKAYNDSKGLTSKFNLNVLTRINNNFNTNFNLSNFKHKSFYREKDNRIEMHLECLKDHIINIDKQEIQFISGETIHTENSYKYTKEGFKEIVLDAGFNVEEILTDKNNFFGIFCLKTF